MSIDYYGVGGLGIEITQEITLDYNSYRYYSDDIYSEIDKFNSGYNSREDAIKGLDELRDCLIDYRPIVLVEIFE